MVDDLVPQVSQSANGLRVALAVAVALGLWRALALADGSDYLAINPKGQVPLLQFDDGNVLSEGPAIVQYIADQVPQKQLAPANGTLPRYRLQEWLTFIGTELHKGFSPLFNPAVPESVHGVFRDKLIGRLMWIDTQLAGKQYLMGDTFTVADAYLYTVSRWGALVKVDTSGLQHLAAFRERMAARPAVQAAIKAEGLPG